MSIRVLAAVAAAVLFGCGGGPPRGPFGTPELPADDPLVADLAECRGDGSSVEACVVDRICAHAFSGPGRFHIRPVGSTPWVQVEVGPDGIPASIELAWSGADATEFEVGLTCAPPVDLSLGEDSSEGALRAPDLDGDEIPEPEEELLSLPSAQRTLAGATGAFAAAENEGLEGELVFQHALWLARAVAGADGAAPAGPEDALLEAALTNAAVVELLANTTLDRGPRYRHEPRGHRWPLAQVLFALRGPVRGGVDGAAGPGVGARAASVLMTLVADPLYAGGSVDGADEPADWLTLVLGGVRPLPPEAATYLRAQTGTERAGFAVIALVDNATDSAVEILRAYLASPRSAFDLRAALLRETVAAQRHLGAPVSVAERLLAGRLPGPIRDRLVLDLFGDWNDELRPDAPMVCPALERVSLPAAAALRRIGADPGRVSPRTRRVVAQGLAELPVP